MRASAELVVLITGCSSGIGRALASELAQRGHRVLATARREGSVAELTAAGFAALPLDVTEQASIDAAVAAVLAEAGRIDLLVNNAGYGLMGPSVEVAPAELRRQLETNVVGAHAVARAVAPTMIERRSGCIVNVGSVSGVLTTPFAGPYCASKAALHALTDALRMELAPFGIHVVSLQPGGVASRFGEAASRLVEGNVEPGSPYAPLAEAIRRRAGEGQVRAMDTALFARRVVDRITRPHPPEVIRLGTHSVTAPLVAWLLPARLSDRLLARRYRLHRLGRS